MAKLRLLLVIAFMFAGLSPPLFADEGMRDISIQIWGSTNTKKAWKCDAKAAIEFIDLSNVKTPVPMDFTGTLQATIKAVISVPEVDCNSGMMNDHLRTALKAKSNSLIFYLMKESVISGNTATISGELTIAGETRPVKLNVNFQRTQEGGGSLSGDVMVNMKDYKVTPPSLMFGTLLVDPNIKIKFNGKIKPLEKN